MPTTAGSNKVLDEQGSQPQSARPVAGKRTTARTVQRIAIAILVAAATGVGLWDPLQIDERSQVQHVTKLATRSLQADITADMESEILAVIRLAKLGTFEEKPSHEAWQSNAELFLADHPSYIAIYWADPAYHVEWTVPHDAGNGNDFELATDTPLKAALQAALELGHSQLPRTRRPSTTPDSDRNQEEATLSPTFLMVNRERACRIVVPVHKNTRLIGFLVAVFEVRKAFEGILVDHSKLGYAVSVLEGDHELYRMNSLNGEGKGDFAQEADVQLRGAKWRIRVWPEAALLGEVRSKLPEVALVIGSLLGFLLVLTVHFGHAARRNSKELQRANDEMEVRVQERTAQVHDLSGRLLQLQDEERRRIARELHDSTAQVLAGVGFYLEKATSLVVKEGRNGAVVGGEHDLLEALHESIRLLEEATTEVRTISYLLHPPMLDDLGLEYVIRWFVGGLSQRSGIQFDLQLQPDLGRLSPQLELALFRIVQEALTNVYRHSGSPTAKITMSRDHSHVTLEVADCGRGIPEGAMDLAGKPATILGVGICGMRERVRQLGGQVEIVSSTRGTTIRAVLPLVLDSISEGHEIQPLSGVANKQE